MALVQQEQTDITLSQFILLLQGSSFGNVDKLNISVPSLTHYISLDLHDKTKDELQDFLKDKNIADKVIESFSLKADSEDLTNNYKILKISLYIYTK